MGGSWYDFGVDGLDLPALSDSLRFETTKWPDSPHWQLDVRRLGEDRFGTWVHAPLAAVIQRGSDPPFSLEHEFVGLVPDGDWWVVEFYPDHPSLSVYVNIGTPPVISEGRVSQVDLDLDVIRLLDGSVEVIDEDEFEEHRVSLGYPQELIDGARTAAERAARLMEEGSEPFGAVFERWLAAARW